MTFQASRGRLRFTAAQVCWQKAAKDGEEVLVPAHWPTEMMNGAESAKIAELYSPRSADIGSMAAARRAGTQQAAAPAVETSAIAMATCTGFPDDRPASNP